MATALPPDEDEEVAVTLGPAMDLTVTVTGTGGAPVPLAVNSKQLQVEVRAERGVPILLPVPLERTIVCAGTPPFGACDVLVPPPDGGVRVTTLEPGLVGQVGFEARLRGAPVPGLVVYLDRVNSRVGPPNEPQHYPVLPGRHVLVLNTAGGPERFELVFGVDAGSELDLGVLELK